MRNWVGLHIIPERIDRAGLLAMIGRLAAAGRPVPIVVVLNDAGLADDIKRASPATIVIFRVETNKDPAVGEDGGKWLDDRLGLARASKLADWVQLACEALSSNPVALSNFYVGMMTRALQVGLKITIGNIASGNPPGDIGAGIEAMRPMLQMASDHGFPLIYHPYSPRTVEGFNDIASEAAFYVQRYKFWRTAFPKLIIFGGEAGTGQPDFQGEKTLTFMKRLNELVDIFVAYWSVGWWNMDDGASQIDAILPEYEKLCMESDPMAGAIPTTDPATGLPAPVVTSPTFGLADFVRDTADDPASEPIVVAKLKPSVPPKNYELMLGDISQGTSHVTPVEPVATWNMAINADGLYIRSGPGKTYPHIGSYNRHLSDGKTPTVVSVLAVDSATLAKQGNYVQIVGQPGHWLAYAYLEPTSIAATA